MLMTAMMMMSLMLMMTMLIILGLQCLRRPWGAHKGQDDVSSPRMSGDDDDHHNQGDHHCVE